MFNEELNIGFLHPKKDQCEECELFKNSSLEEKVLAQQFDLHIKEKDHYTFLIS